MAFASHMWRLKLKLSIVKIQFLVVNYILSDLWLHVTSTYHIRQCKCGTFPSLQKVLSDSVALNYLKNVISCYCFKNSLSYFSENIFFLIYLLGCIGLSFGM